MWINSSGEDRDDSADAAAAAAALKMRKMDWNEYERTMIHDEIYQHAICKLQLKEPMKLNYYTYIKKKQIKS